MTTQWPALPFDAWSETCETLHRIAQIVGKIQLALTPVVNHFWNVTLRVTARGLATSALRSNDRTFDLEIDLVEHRVVVRTSDGDRRTLELRPRPVCDFYRDLMATLSSLGIAVSIWDHPVELETEAIPFSQDRIHAAYDRDAANRFFRVLAGAQDVLEELRARFLGKCSGVGFYWGTFDLSVARYCGRSAPEPLPTGALEREAYSHEVSEVGFWPGDASHRAPAFFALHYPAPDGYARAKVRPDAASWDEAKHCFVLPYEACREHDTRAQILAFCQSTYEAGASLARWDRAELERPSRGEEAAMTTNRDSHLSAAHPVTPTTEGCEECLRQGMEWVHLRVCLSCGHVGCCDSSPGKHATQHFHATAHPIIESFEPAEDWGWCYVDSTFVELPRELLVAKGH